MIREFERFVVNGVGFTAFHNLAEYALVFLMRVQVEMILPREKTDRLSTGVRISPVNPDEVELCIQINDRNMIVVENPLQNLGVFVQLRDVFQRNNGCFREFL